MTTQDVRRDASCRKFLARFQSDRSGNVAVIFALSAVVLLLAIGAAVDVGRWLHARDQTMAAIDAALLAGGRYLQTQSKDTAGALAMARKFYDQNVTSRIPVTNDTITFTVADNGMAITASGNAFLKTPFLQLASIDKLPLINTATAEFSKAEIAVGGNGGENLEVSMMLDVTGSMCNSPPSSNQQPCTSANKLNALKDAAKDLVDIVVWKDQSKYTSKIALVPFSEDVKLPTTTARDEARGNKWPETQSKQNCSWFGCSTTNYYRSDCMVERTGSSKFNDASPNNGSKAVTPHYTEDYDTVGGSWWGGGTKVGKCTVNSDVVPLTSDQDKLKSAIDDLKAKGGTAGQVGTAWAWYVLSPNWSSLWDTSSQPRPYGTEKLKKSAILMTDGEYNTSYDEKGIVANNDSGVNGSSSYQAEQLCSGMKAKGITVYTVLFGQKNNQSAINTMNKCATDSTKFYNAEDNEQLKQAFRDIALKLSSLYLSK